MPSSVLLPFSTALLLASFLSCVHPQPLPLPDAAGCGTDLLRLAPCLPFANGAVLAPPDACCNNLGSVLRDHPSCVCRALGRPGALPVNRTLALELPRLCRINLTADAGNCPGVLPSAPSASPPAGANSSASSMPPPTLLPPPSPRMNSLLLGESRGLKLRVDGTSEALGFMALVLALAF